MIQSRPAGLAQGRVAPEGVVEITGRFRPNVDTTLDP